MTNPSLFSNFIHDVIQVEQKYCACDFFDTQVYYCLIYQMALLSLLDKNISFHLYFIHRNRSKRFLWLHHTHKESHLNELITFFHISSWCQSNLKNNLPFINDRQQIWIISDPLLCLTPIYTMAMWKYQPNPHLVWRHLWIAPQPSAYYPEIDILLPLKFNTNCKIILHMEFYSLTSIAMLKYYVSCYQYC